MTLTSPPHTAASVFEAPAEASTFSSRLQLGWPGYFLPIASNPFFESLGKDLSLEEMGGHLFLWLADRLPVARVLLFTLEKRTHSMMSMFDAGLHPSIISRIVDVGSNLPKEATETALSELGQVVFLRNDDPAFRRFLQAVEPSHASAMCMLLNRDEEFAQYLGVFSDLPDTFFPEHGEIVAQLRPPLRACIQRRFYDFNLRQGMAITPKTDPVELLTMCEGLRPLLKRVENIAATDQPVIVMGETGVGKDVMAETVYRLSKRCHSPMVRINCGAISETLMDSELFGHEKGSFTGAINTRAGYFEQADGGTIFLDEVGELPLAVQVRLLRVLDHGEIRRVGGTRPVQLHLRIIAATNRDLAKEVKAGRFREDLWYRLCVYPLRVPPLRERPEDVLTLVKYFIASKASRMGIDVIPRLDTRDLHAITQYPWPGNVRQLEHTVERALLEHQMNGANAWLRMELDPTSDEPSVSPLPQSSDPLITLDELVRKHILHILAHTHGKISGPRGAAALLGLPPSTLRAKMRKLGIG